MTSFCECVNRRIDVACGSANCRATRIYDHVDILDHITVVKTGMRCDLPSWWWTKKHHFRVHHNDIEKFVEEIKKEI